MPHTYPGASTNAMYNGSPGISSVHLVGYGGASCSSFHIPCTNCLTTVDFSRFTHASSLPSTAVTGFNIPFADGMPIVVWRNFAITESNVFKFTRTLRLVSFRACNIFHVYLVLVLRTLLLRQKYSLEITFFSCRPYPLSNFLSGIGSWVTFLVTEVGVNTVCIPPISVRDRCSRYPSNFG